MIVLDTHAWVWWVGDPDALSNKARKAIAENAATGSVYISCMSTWEIALLNRRGRLELRMDVQDWIAHSEAIPYFRFVPIDNQIVIKSVFLPSPLHQDPADRIIIATALNLGAAVVSKDQKIGRYPHVRTVW